MGPLVLSPYPGTKSHGALSDLNPHDCVPPWTPYVGMPFEQGTAYGTILAAWWSDGQLVGDAITVWVEPKDVS